MLGCGVSREGERTVPAALHVVVGTTADRVPGTSVFTQHHPRHHGVRTQGVQGTVVDEKGASRPGKRNGLDSGLEDAKRDCRGSSYGTGSRSVSGSDSSRRAGNLVVSERRESNGASEVSEDGLACGFAKSKGAILPPL